MADCENCKNFEAKKEDELKLIREACRDFCGQRVCKGCELPNKGYTDRNNCSIFKLWMFGGK